jgi:hypothetical protein
VRTARALDRANDALPRELDLLEGADFVQALAGCRDFTWERFLGLLLTPHVRFDESPACVVDDSDSRWTCGGIGGRVDTGL